MSFEMVRKALLWCTVINYGVLLMWWLCFLVAHDWMYRLHGRWFHLSREQFDALPLAFSGRRERSIISARQVMRRNAPICPMVSVAWYPRTASRLRPPGAGANLPWGLLA